MTDYLWLLAQAYIAQRLGYLTTIILPVHQAIRDALDATGRLPRPADNCTDSEIRETFREFIVRLGENVALPNKMVDDFIEASREQAKSYKSDFREIDSTNLPAASDDDVTAFTEQLTKPKKGKGK